MRRNCPKVRLPAAPGGARSRAPQQLDGRGERIPRTAPGRCAIRTLILTVRGRTLRIGDRTCPWRIRASPATSLGWLGRRPTLSAGKRYYEVDISNLA